MWVRNALLMRRLYAFPTPFYAVNTLIIRIKEAVQRENTR